MKTNTLLCGDTLYHLDAAYRAGARAMRANRPYGSCNPYSAMSTQYDQFNYGHVNESDGEHVRIGVDVIELAPTGRCFVEDAAIAA